MAPQSTTERAERTLPCGLRRFAVAAAAAAVAVVACRGEPAAIRHVAASTPAPSSAAPKLAEPATSEAPASDSSAPLPATAPSTREDPRAVQMTDWLLEQHAKADATISALGELGPCLRATVGGSEARPALVCEDGRAMPASYREGESVFPYSIIVADHGRARLAFQVPYSAGPLDQFDGISPDDPNGGMYVMLTVEIEPGGSRVTVREEPGRRSCAQAAADYAKDPGDAPHRHMIALACAARGTYVWRQGRFVRGRR